ncbi:plant UBX domain-containing protein 4-like [Curcuma longa]|uniref:plant UBX domain-containing protein 4-like n=1 Tax=Curcuma longa TaxID=136217 RepID=UPI003D9F651C
MEARGGGPEEEEKKRLAETFVGIAASTQEEALFFLESHGWNLDSAIVSFYDHQADPQGHRSPLHRGQDDAHDPDDEDEDYLPTEESLDSAPPARVTRSTTAAAASPPRETRAATAPGSRGDKKASKPSGSRSTIRTLADLNRRADPDSDSDEDGPQEYYTGGEKSGMLVQDPSQGGNNVDAIFEQARRMGAGQGTFEPSQSSSSRSFTGTGRLLSGESVPSAPVPDRAENIVHNIYFWRNGFTVNDGPLRRFEDPENASFLESITKSECPKELEPADRRTAVNVNLIRRQEDYSEPVRRTTAFQGVGRTLGGGSSDNSATEPTAASDASSAVAPSLLGLSVDPLLPSTSIQLRLADGTRMVARFNLHHTVGHIRAFIDASRPGSSRTYQLQTVGFPPKQLNDLDKTIDEAGLANSVIIQKG